MWLAWGQVRPVALSVHTSVPLWRLPVLIGSLSAAPSLIMPKELTDLKFYENGKSVSWEELRAKSCFKHLIT